MEIRRPPNQTPSKKKNAKEAAQVYAVKRLLDGAPSRRRLLQSIAMPIPEHPAVLIQAALQETFRPRSPIEIYSDDQPSFRPQSPEEEGLVPIDILFGKYDYKTQTITIFHRNIERFASKQFKCPYLDLEILVRLHEYAHALEHLGVFWAEEPQTIKNYVLAGSTDWTPFIKSRSTAFRLLPTVHEFLAQILCWITIEAMQPSSYRQTLQTLFKALMSRQPPQYQLSSNMLSKASSADPTNLLSWVRQYPLDKQPRYMSHLEFAEALLT